MKTKTAKQHPFERITDWSVTNHGIQLFSNLEPRLFASGCSLDVEDDERGNFVGIGIFDGEACYYWSDWELAKQLTIPKFIAHNGISDLRKLQKWGFKIDESWLIYDTQLMGHIIDSSLRTYGLKDMVKRELGMSYPSYEEICGKKGSKNHKTLDQFPAEAVAEYNSCDTYFCYQLYLRQTKGQGLLAESSLEKPALDYFHRVEAPASVVFKEMETRGIRIDRPYLTKLEATLSSQRAVIEKEIKNELGDINLSSPKQLLGALHEKDIYPELKGKASTDKRALSRLDRIPVVQRLLSYSEYDTLLSSFVQPYLERGVDEVHPHFSQTGTRTGRPSCSNPNLLQIPRKTENGKLVRRMFVPRECNCFGELDYGQIEPRLMAHLSGDAVLSKMFNENVDFHSFTAERLKLDRDAAKVLNLSVGYRATFKSVSAQLKCSDQEAQEQIDSWWSAFPQLHAWQTKLIWQAKRDGYFTTLMGRRIKVDNLNEYTRWKREAAERQLINNIAQASATEVMKLAMVAVYKAGITMLVQVYDSLLVEALKEDIEDTVQHTAHLMENAYKLDVPLTVDCGIGSDWAACKGK